MSILRDPALTGCWVRAYQAREIAFLNMICKIVDL